MSKNTRRVEIDCVVCNQKKSSKWKLWCDDCWRDNEDACIDVAQREFSYGGNVPSELEGAARAARRFQRKHGWEW